jgi:hypothetical protein
MFCPTPNQCCILTVIIHLDLSTSTASPRVSWSNYALIVNIQIIHQRDLAIHISSVSARMPSV